MAVNHFLVNLTFYLNYDCHNFNYVIILMFSHNFFLSFSI